MPIDGKAIAIPNNDYVHVAWDFGEELSGCTGFAVYRMEPHGPADGVPVSSFARDSKGGRLKTTCEDQPIRKYSWRDVYAKRGSTYQYRVVPMAGPRKPMPDIKAVLTSLVTVSPRAGNAEIYFNRGLLATQHTSDLIWDPAHSKPDFGKIEALINDETSDLRRSLSGQLYEALTKLLERAKAEGGSCWAALYELTDNALIRELSQCKDLHLILSNDNDDSKKKIYDGKNQPGAAMLNKTAKELIRRYMPSGQIGHNKFLVYVDAHDKPTAVLSGSTNWTASGLCTQSNNAIVIESGTLAAQYLAYWKELKADALAAGIPRSAAPMHDIQGKELRAECAKQQDVNALNKQSTVRPWYSPNTASLIKSGKGKKPPIPVDLREVYALIHGAEQSVLFLAFMPGKADSEGSNHFLKELADVSIAKPALFVRGAVSDPDLTTEFERSMLNTADNEDAMIASPKGLFKDFKAWRKEIYQYGHAIIHDKTIVVDPFSESKCAVITGSHNLGFRASSNNDENMLIIRGDLAVAQAYAVHVMDIFEHYRSRWIGANHKDDDYDPNDPKHALDWQDRYFDRKKPAFAERLFWLSAGAPLPVLQVNSKEANAKAAMDKAFADRKAAAAARKAARKAAKDGTATKSSRGKSARKAARKSAAGKSARRSASRGSAKRGSRKSAPKKTVRKGSRRSRG